jgi:hypothetical protein
MSLPANHSPTPTQKAMSVKRSYQEELMSKANVVGVGVGFQNKGGEKTDNVAIIVMVRRKLPKSQLAPQDIVPTELEGVPIDVQEVGDIKAY